MLKLRNKLLITLVLISVASVAVWTDRGNASTGRPPVGFASGSGLNPGVSPASGEPDVTGNTAPPKVGALPAGQGSWIITIQKWLLWIKVSRAVQHPRTGA